jgi:galactitol-specific phosphotransferase system IIB component
MHARNLTMLALCALLAACGRGNGNSSSKSFDDSFDKSFQEKFVGSCVSSAANSGVSQELAGKLCTCASDKVKQRFSVAQKMHLTKDQLRPILLECKASIPA